MQYKLKSNNYSELTVVNVADGWRERNVWYQGRSCQQEETEYESCSNNEWQEVSRGHSTIVVDNKKLREFGYPAFTEFYLKICEN